MQVTKEYVILRYARSVFGNFVQWDDIISIAIKEWLSFILTLTTPFNELEVAKTRLCW